MNGHVCACGDCRPDLLPPTRMSEAHVGMRFRETWKYRGRCVVRLDGIEVTERCFELLAGEEGWVALWSEDDQGKRHVCESHDRLGFHNSPYTFPPSACFKVLHGQVSFSARAVAS